MHSAREYNNNTVIHGKDTKMIYKAVEPCPAGQYCNGVQSMPLCNTGSYNPTIGINDYIAGGHYATKGAKISNPGSNNDCVDGGQCGLVSAGYYSTGGAKISTPGSNSDCVGDGNTCGPCGKGENCPAGSSGKQQCPAGYYCTAGTSENCPGGTTSVKGASEEKQCYIMGDKDGTKNGTKFCVKDNNNDYTTCFYIPNHFGPNAPGTN